MNKAVKLVELKEKALNKAIEDFEIELEKPDVDSDRVTSLSKVINVKAENLVKAYNKLGEEYLKASKDDEFLLMEEELGNIQIKVDAVDKKAFQFLQRNHESPAQTRDVKSHLPQLKLQEFGGDVRDWLRFWASFQELHNNPTISESDKFQYLLQCVPAQSPARKSIEGLPVCSKNYQKAIKALTDTYGNKKTLVKVYVRDLLELVIRNANQRTQVDLMELVPTLSSQIRNLGELGVTTDQCEVVLYPVVESCLPEEVLEAWQRNQNYKEQLEPLIEFLEGEVHNKLERTLAKMNFGEAAREKSVKAKKEKTPDQPSAAAFMDASVPAKDSKKSTCAFCDDGRHETEQCGKAKTEMTLEQRKAVLKDKKCCYKCLKRGHITKHCKKYVRCCICSGHHYEILCSGKKKTEGDKNVMMSTKQSGSPVSSSSFTPPQVPAVSDGNSLWSQDNGGGGGGRVGFSNLTGNESITLSTMIVYLETPQQRWRVRVFLDSGSEASYITKHVADMARLEKVGERSFRHQLFGGSVTESKQHPRYQITLRSLDDKVAKTFTLNGIERIACKIKKPQYGPWISNLAAQGIFFHDQTEAPDDVHILLGMDVMAQILTGGFHRINEYLFANQTVFGWVVGGAEVGTSHDVTTSNMVTTMMVNELTVENLWSLESMGIKEDSTSETKEDLEKATSEFFEKNVTRQEDGRYVVPLPWKEGHRKLTSNFHSCLARLKKTSAELKAQGYWPAYDQIFRDWEYENIIEEVPTENVEDMYLLPHRHVIKESSVSTPVRPVFDAGSKGKGGPSLNDCLSAGPNLLELIPAIMCRFRKEEFGAVSDIRKAFLQIELQKSDQQYLQFLWWQDNTCSKLKLYRHRRVVFGVKPSPFLLAATLSHHVKNATDDENFKTKLLGSLYVDNSCSSHESLKLAKDFQRRSQQLLLPAKFDLRGWEFSKSATANYVPVLGMMWETKEDVITLCLESVIKKLDGPNTKRHLLSMVNSLFDPMGYCCAFTLIPKMLLQECCSFKLGWDEELPVVIVEKLTKWKSQVPVLKKLKIPRWIGYSAKNSSITIHCYCDASRSAFGTNIFVRVETGNTVTVQLVLAKSRVAPLKTKVTIPRLELLGCGLGARLTANHVIKYLEMESCQTYFWTDSMTALTWIRIEKEWTRFVANRVESIRKITKKEEWYHVPGEMNPADVPSRGCTAAYLIENRFWEGPGWLYLPAENWPCSKIEINEELVNQEKKATVVTCHTQKSDDNVLDRLAKFSDYQKILRVLVYILKFISKTRKGYRSLITKNESTISAKDINGAEIILLKLIQQTAFTGAQDTQLKGMGAFTDDEGLIRVKSQLLFGNDNFGLRCPIVLPHKDPIVKALIFKEHSLNSHAGAQILQARIREKFWITKCRRTISGVVTSCPVCKRFIARRCEVPTPQLPLHRIRDTAAFNITGVDLAGPLYLRGDTKAWIVLFTCSVYRAIHLELVTSLSTQAFLNAFRRFISRRGRPSQVFSDNGLNFVGCANLFKSVNWKSVQQYAIVEKMDWRFNPPTAAWWGGWWERLIGLVKQLIRRILGRKTVDYDGMNTILCDVEHTINQRPLTYMSEKDELLPLCPAQFMKDNPGSHLPEADVVDGDSIRKSLKVCQTLREELRGRFRREYLGQLQHNAKMKMLTVKPGDVVIVEDDNKRRLDWSLGVVVDVFPGRDGNVRTAKVRTKDGVFLRAVQRLFIMEVAESSGLEAPVEQEVIQDNADEKVEEPQVPVSRFGRKIKKPDRLTL